MKKIEVIIVALIFTNILSCGEFKNQESPVGSSGVPGAEGSSGKPGTNVILGSIKIENIDQTGDWDSFYITVSSRTRVMIPKSIHVNDLNQNENGGWLDIYIQNETFCYQGVSGTKRYDFSYKKVYNYIDGCDLNNEKEGNAFPLSSIAEIGEKVGIVPRAPRLNGVLWSLELDTLVEN